MRKLLFLLPVFVLILGTALAQTGTQHGICLTWTAPTIGTGEPALSGYNVYRTIGSGPATKINTTLVIGTTYVDPNSDITVGTTYSYDVTAVDANGNESTPSNTASITPTTLIVNPGAPSGCNAKQQ